jgi:Uma2 family endonuclease
MDGSGKRGAKMRANDRMFRAIVEDEPLQCLAEAEQTLAMSAVAKRWTGNEVRALIEANPLHTPRYELIDGELLETPAPNFDHQAAVRQLMLTLARYLDTERVGEVCFSPFDIELENESLVQPDVFVIPPLPVPRPRKIRQLKKLLLAIEVISPSSARGDRVKKRTYFTRNRVPQYWVVDLDARVFERSTPDEPRPEVLVDSITWHPVGAAGPLTIDLPKFFRDVLGEAVPTE